MEEKGGGERVGAGEKKNRRQEGGGEEMRMIMPHLIALYVLIVAPSEPLHTH